MVQKHQEVDLERVFDLIKNGKSQREKGQHWDAAWTFLKARGILKQLAAENATDSQEQQKIQKLYEDQSTEYFHRSRESLIEAMQEESAKDKQGEFIKSQQLPGEEARKRNDLFISVFSKPLQQETVNAEATATVSERKRAENKKVLEKQLSLEERLSNLNASLPKELKSSQQRMQDLSSGLKRLGLGAIATGGIASNPLKIEPTKPTSQQVADIIAQAQDEVAMQVPDNEAAAETGLDDSDSGGLSDQEDHYLSDDDSADSILSDELAELPNVGQIKDAIASTQAKLAELLALIEHEEELQGGAGEGGHFDPVHAKQGLKDAKTFLNKALRLWKVKAKQTQNK